MSVDTSSRPSDGTPPPLKSMTNLTWACKIKRAKNPLKVPAELVNHPQYEVLKELGRGGMGIVYLARNKLMDRLEVLKVVNHAFVAKPGSMERFLREIQTAAKLRHNNVVGAYSALQLGELLGFAMEYIKGQDLHQVVETQGPLPVVHACHYISQAALGLQHAHDKGTIHRDIKPQNLILARDGKKHIVKILDFGLAKATRDKKVDTALTGVGALLGTPDYMAHGSEQIFDASLADIRADIYSLGCTLYYLLTGKPPFRAANVLELLNSHQSADAVRLDVVRTEIPARLAAVVSKMMAKDPAKRFQQPCDVVRALAPFVQPARAKHPGSTPTTGPRLLAPETDEFAFASETIVSEPSATPVAKSPPQPPKKPRRLKWVASGLAFLAALLLGGVVLWPTPHGTVRIESDDPNVEFVFDKNGPTIRGADKSPISLRAGAHGLIVTRGDFEFASDRFEIASGETVTLKVELLRDKIQLTRDGKELASKALPKTDSAIAKANRKDASPPAPASADTLLNGILVLDDCDPDFGGKAEFKDNLTFWDAKGAEKFRLSGFNNSAAVAGGHRIAIDGRRKSIWVIENTARRLRRFDFAGKPTLTVEQVPGIALAIDPETGNAWVTRPSDGGPGKTVVYDVDGKLVSSHAAAGLEIVYDKKLKSFWIAQTSLTRIDAATGQIQFSVPLASFCVSSLAADPKAGGVWAAIRSGGLQNVANRVVKIDANGNKGTVIELGPKDPFNISVDPNDGGVWVACLRQSIERYSPDGILQTTRNLPALNVLAASDGGVWAVTPSGVQRFSPLGEITHRLNHASNSDQVWIAAIEMP